MITSEDRFWKKVRKTSGCWIWTAAKGNFGYWIAWFGKRLCKAHRVSWFLKFGKWPSKQLLHGCDVPACVNPDHLREGTQQENIDDAISKGRLKPGEYQTKKTHCPAGHDYKVHGSKGGPSGRWRRCRECHRAKEAQRRKG